MKMKTKKKDFDIIYIDRYKKRKGGYLFVKKYVKRMR